MRVKISPAYLGLSASQSKRSKNKDRAVTRNIWMTRDGLRIPVNEMTDQHLVYAVSSLRGVAIRIKKWAEKKAEWYRLASEAYDASHNEDFFSDSHGDNLDLSNWYFPTPMEEKESEYRALSKMGVERIIRLFVPCWPKMVLEGYKRELLHSNGYLTDKGFKILNGEKIDG